MPTSTVEDYLKAIFRLSPVDGGLAPMGKVAESLGVTAGTATTMIKQLVRQGYADYSPRKGVALTETGRLAVMKVIRRHRLLELFLVEKMNFDWSEVHEEAEILEHAASERLINRMDEMLGLPARDPHGDPIPGADGSMRQEDSKPLSEYREGSFELKRVTRTEPAFLEWMSSVGLNPGATFRLNGRDELADVFRVSVENRDSDLSLGEKVVKHLWVAELG